MHTNRTAARGEIYSLGWQTWASSAASAAAAALVLQEAVSWRRGAWSWRSAGWRQPAAVPTHGCTAAAAICWEGAQSSGSPGSLQQTDFQIRAKTLFWWYTASLRAAGPYLFVLKEQRLRMVILHTTPFLQPTSPFVFYITTPRCQLQIWQFSLHFNRNKDKPEVYTANL